MAVEENKIGISKNAISEGFDNQNNSQIDRFVY
jgi:hypothetical protein